jgi:hypothetical protein
MLAVAATLILAFDLGGTMVLRKYEQRLASQLSSELGEPILRCIALNAATMRDRMRLESFTPLWRPSLIVNGQPQSRLPQTMFLILTPTRVLITDTKRGMTGYRPILGSTILTLRRGDAEITTVQDDDGLWLYHLKSLAQSAELDLELASSGIAVELAGQLREFSVAQPPGAPTSGLTAPPEPAVASQMLDARRRWRTKSYRISAALGVVLSLLFFGFGAYQVYGYHAGTPTKATIVSCSHTAKRTRSCRGTWTLHQKTYAGRIWGDTHGMPDGSVLDVRVYNDAAFAPGIPKWPFIGAAICAVIAVYLFMPERRRRRSATL